MILAKKEFPKQNKKRANHNEKVDELDFFKIKILIKVLKYNSHTMKFTHAEDTLQ